MNNISSNKFNLKVLCYMAIAGITAISNYAICADFYVDPINGTAGGDGSADNPWKSLQEVIDSGLIESYGWDSLPPDDGVSLVVINEGAPVKAKDTIRLHEGDYGALNLTGYYNKSDITVEAVDGEEARFTNLLIRSSSNWIFRGLTISPEYGESYDPATMIDIDSHDWNGPVHDITIDNCNLQSVDDVSKWTIDDWNDLPANGINADGDNITITNNYLRNVNFGISVGATNSLIMGNTVENFAGDGMRGLGDYSVFAYNTVKNCYDVNDNHDDGFQSWSVGDDGVGTGVVKGIVLRGNTIINYEDANQPFRGPLQGIGCFDGTFEDWTIENNVIYTNHWHGISLYGARNCTIVNNTVLDPDNEDPGPPWIMITDHKDGTPPENCVIANNLTTAVSGSDLVTKEGNIIIDDPDNFFIDYAALDFHLLPESSAVDSAVDEYAPSIDHDKIPRPAGAGFDVGAYEWHEESVKPVTDTDLAVEDTDTSDVISDDLSNNTSDDSKSSSDTGGCGCSSIGKSETASLSILRLIFLK
ncbi:MAG: right-handed parallel beta-helix repeat-containing protein [Deltaproteobacteria bacterium]|nr:right-handed parallel beta-helix repeat-containing protein [Deltaproteobacteria bacterium]